MPRPTDDLLLSAAHPGELANRLKQIHDDAGTFSDPWSEVARVVWSVLPATEARHLRDGRGADPTMTGADDVDGHDNGRVTVWCETCQHGHIVGIPAITWLCRDCGWGQWSEADAKHHVELCSDHRPYRVGHWIPERIRRARIEAKVDELERIAFQVQNVAQGYAVMPDGKGYVLDDDVMALATRLRESASVLKLGLDR